MPRPADPAAPSDPAHLRSALKAVAHHDVDLGEVVVVEAAGEIDAASEAGVHGRRTGGEVATEADTEDPESAGVELGTNGELVMMAATTSSTSTIIGTSPANWPCPGAPTVSSAPS